MKPFTVKSKVAKKKKRIENAPHWTHSAPVTSRRKALDALQTNRQFAMEKAAHDKEDYIATMRSERDRLASRRDLERPGMQFFANRKRGLEQLIMGNMAEVRALTGRPHIQR